MLLDEADPLPHRPARIVVAGTSGAGKTTLARRLSLLLDVPHTEIDALFHGPDWTPRPTFVEDVEAFSAEPAWVTEWQYSVVRPLLAERADLLVWLDLSRASVMRQVGWRTLRRRLRREELWNGNREPPLWHIFTNPDHMLRWSWRTHATTPSKVAAVQQEHPELIVVRLRSRRAVEKWLRCAFQQR